MATPESVQLHLIDSAVAKRVLQRRTILQYTIDSVQTQSTHTIYFDTPNRDVYQTHRTISLSMTAKEPQQLAWHEIHNHQTPQLIDTYTLTERRWPDAIHTWLTTHNILSHHL
jgi:hypothetical protein